MIVLNAAIDISGHHICAVNTDVDAVRWEGLFEPRLRVAKSVAESRRERDWVQVLIYRKSDVNNIHVEFEKTGATLSGRRVIDERFYLVEYNISMNAIPALLSYRACIAFKRSRPMAACVAR